MTAEFRVLGPLEVRFASSPITLRGLRQQKLLALLLAHRDAVVPVDHLVEALWDDPPPSARQQIHNVVGAVRRALAPLPGVGLATTTSGYRLTVPRSSVDVHRFEEDVRRAEQAAAADRVDEAVRLLGRALAHWRGPALAGLGGRRLDTVAAGLEERRLAATELSLRLRLRRGDAGRLVGELVGLVGQHPLRESLRHSLMVALARSGRAADALAVFDEGRRLLAAELGLDPGPALRALHRQILDGGPAGEQGRSAGAGRGPCSLPHDVTDFTGRQRELDRLLALAGPAGSAGLRIVAIDGTGGVGKTAVAVHLAHRLADRYPDGQHFVDLQGFAPGAGPAPPARALATLLRLTGTPAADVPADLAGRSALWRARTAGRALLLVLDDAARAEQVRPLLPGTAEALVLVTSRRKLSGLAGSVPLPLGVPGPEDAVALLAAVAGRRRVAAEPAAAAELVRLCGRLPLAVRAAAVLLRDGDGTVGQLVDRLRDRRRRVRLLGAGDRGLLTTVTASYESLRPEHARLLRQLSLGPGRDFDAGAAAALAEVPPEDAEAALEAMYEDNLLRRPAAGRYQLDDLVRDCVRELRDRSGDEADRHPARRRPRTSCVTAPAGRRSRAARPC